jgi:hypothetical protein
MIFARFERQRNFHEMGRLAGTPISGQPQTAFSINPVQTDCFDWA